MGILTTGGVYVPTTAAKTRSHYNALDAILTILYQQCSDMQLDVGQNIVQLPCVECCVKLLEFAHTRQSMRNGRVTATRQLQHDDTSLRVFFVLGALVPAMLLATWWVRPCIDDGWSGQSDHSGKIALALITISNALMLKTHLSSSFKHIVGFECHDRVLSSVLLVSTTIDDA